MAKNCEACRKTSVKLSSDVVILIYVLVIKYIVCLILYIQSIFNYFLQRPVSSSIQLFGQFHFRKTRICGSQSPLLQLPLVRRCWDQCFFYLFFLFLNLYCTISTLTIPTGPEMLAPVGDVPSVLFF